MQGKVIYFQRRADFVSIPLDALNSAGAWFDKGFTNLAGYIDASRAGEWVGSAAEWVTQKECAAYNYCINGLQEFLPNSDVERILDGSGLILMGGFKMAGGAFLTFAGALTSYTGIGLGGMAAGTVTGVSGISDIEQGINEIKLGLRNDSTTRTGNYVRDTLYDGNDTIYHLSTGTAAMVGMALRPYVMPQKNPVLAGGKQKDIAKKAAMGADDAAGGAEGGFKPGTLSNVDARRWYLEQEAKIPDLIDDSLPIEQQARQAFDLRNQYRTQARELMLDLQLAESLFRTDPNLTWDQIIQKQVAKGLSGDDIYREILESSQRSRTSVNQSLGLE